MNIYIHELKSLKKSTIIWTVVLAALALMYFSMYPSITSDAEDFKKILAGYPPTVRAMLGINLDYITSVIGYYSMIISIILICAAIQAMNLGLSILSKESRERTADFLLVKPVSRFSIVSAKVLAALTALIATNVVYGILSFGMANIFKTSDFSGKLFFMMNLTIFFIQLMFFAIGLVISVFFNKLKSVLPISLGVVFGSYMLGAILASGKDSEAARFLSPFKYFDNNYIIKNERYETSYLIGALVIVVVSITASYFIYIKKDIHAVS